MQQTLCYIVVVVASVSINRASISVRRHTCTSPAMQCNARRGPTASRSITTVTTFLSPVADPRFRFGVGRKASRMLKA